MRRVSVDVERHDGSPCLFGTKEAEVLASEDYSKIDIDMRSRDGMASMESRTHLGCAKNV